MTSTDRADKTTTGEIVADPDRGREIYDLDRAYVFYSWSAQSRIHPLPLAGAEGSYVWDYEGNRYLDFSSQMVNTNIGHQHPVVVEAIREQAARLCTIAPQYANDQRSEAARRIVDRSRFAEGAKVFFTNAGAEAVEHAVRMARLHTGRPKVLATYRSYHGATGTAINLTGDARRWPSDTGTAGVEHFFGPFLYRSPFHSTSFEEESARALAHLDQVIALEGPSTIAAIILETVPGTSGIMPPPPGYLSGVRALCDRHGILLIADEVMCGFGRCGEWFAVDHWEITPDLITFAKGVNSGYVPLGGVVVAAPVVETFAERPYPGGLTYSGHPLACAAAVATIDLMEREQDRRARRGHRLHRARARARRARGLPSGRRGRARVGRVLGTRAGDRPCHQGAARPVRVLFSGDGRARRRVPRARPAALHQLQPPPRRPALHGERRGDRGGPRHPR